jgi:hypothetical protein
MTRLCSSINWPAALLYVFLFSLAILFAILFALAIVFLLGGGWWTWMWMGV